MEDNELQQLKKEEFDLTQCLNKVREKIQKIHSDRKEKDSNYCERCETSPCSRHLVYDEDED